MPKKTKLYEKIIPKFIPNSIVLFFFSIIAFLSGAVKKNIIEEHFNENKKLIEGERILLPGRLIENQKELGKIKFGSHKRSDMCYSGCGIIATYNALISMGETNVNLPKLISHFEKRGAALKGGFGITPSQPAAYIKKRGYSVKKITSRKREVLDGLGNEYKTFIVTFYWNKENIKDQLHTICISKENDGFYLHNVYHYDKANRAYSRKGTYKSLGEAIYSLGENAVPLVSIGIK